MSDEHKDTPRFVVKSEPTPQPKPRWWRSMYLVVDTATDAVISRWYAWGTANMDATCRNSPDMAFCATTRDLAARNAERWAAAS